MMIARKLRWTFLFLFTLMLASSSSSLVIIEDGAVPEHKEELIRDLQKTSGLWLNIQKGVIRELPFAIPSFPFVPPGGHKASATARHLLLSALQSDVIYRVRSTADARLASVSSSIDLNFDQLRVVTYRDVPREAFGAGIVFLHELAHTHRGLVDPDPEQKKINPDVKGPTVEFINRIQRELGLPERLHYFPKKIAGKNNIFCIYFGEVDRVEIDAKVFS
jgi:hypothetical protein